MRRVLVLVALIALCSACAKLSPPPAKVKPHKAKSIARDPNQYGGAANFVNNPSFERTLEPWTPYSPSSYARRGDTASRTGIAAAGVVALGASPYGLQYVGVVASPSYGERFIFSSWVRSIDRPKLITLLVESLGPSNAQSPEIIVKKRFPIDKRWRRFRVTGTERRRDRTLVVVAVFVDRSVAAGDGFLVDDVLLKNPNA